METISPTRCVVCDEPGSPLCASCASELPFIDLNLACPRCGAPFGRHLCTECPMPGSEEAKAHPECAFPFVGARSALSYEGGAKDIIRAYKDEDELRLDTVIASFICNAMRGRTAGKAPSEAKAPADWTQWADALVYVPASPEALRRRGFDHMERIAQICGERTGLPVLNALTCKEGILDQRDLGRTQRQANRSESFETNPKVSVHNKRIVLIDDVFTTGATASAATTTLLSAGAPAVTTTTYARVW